MSKSEEALAVNKCCLHHLSETQPDIVRYKDRCWIVLLCGYIVYVLQHTAEVDLFL